MRELPRRRCLLVTAVLILILAPYGFGQLYGWFLNQQTSEYLAAVDTRWQLELPIAVEQVLYTGDSGERHCYVLTCAESLAEQPWELVSAAEAQAYFSKLAAGLRPPMRNLPDWSTLTTARTIMRARAPDNTLYLVYFDHLTLAGVNYQHVLDIVERSS